MDGMESFFKAKFTLYTYNLTAVVYSPKVLSLCPSRAFGDAFHRNVPFTGY